MQHLRDGRHGARPLPRGAERRLAEGLRREKIARGGGRTHWGDGVWGGGLWGFWAPFWLPLLLGRGGWEEAGFGGLGVWGFGGLGLFVREL